ncbi:MAG: hypothetical protein ACTSYD_13255 [Candidatus Heimdallarchaeaceae archaeon]
MSSLYERIWLNKKHRTIFISVIITIASLILAILFASVDREGAAKWLQGLYPTTPGETYSVGLTILEMIFMMIFYFFLLMTIATLSELKASFPSWGTIISSSIIALIVSWLVTVIKPGEAKQSNFSPAMRWTLLGGLLGFIVLSTIYLIFTETPEE